ncbi:MAG: hypothetical protein RIF33_26220 [Cyclobacteriaceae bacterium]
MKHIIVMFVLSILTLTESLAQCAMCRTTLENNVSNGEAGIAAGINFGIMYLFFAPYVLIGTAAYFWYRKSKVHAREIEVKGRIKRKVSTL